MSPSEPNEVAVKCSTAGCSGKSVGQAAIESEGWHDYCGPCLETLFTADHLVRKCEPTKPAQTRWEYRQICGMEAREIAMKGAPDAVSDIVDVMLARYDAERNAERYLADRDRYGEALELIRDTDPVDAVLDPDRARRVAQEALAR